MEIGKPGSRDDKGKDTGRSEAGRRQVGDRSEEFQSEGQLNGLQNPEFRRADLRKSEFES